MIEVMIVVIIKPLVTVTIIMTVTMMTYRRNRMRRGKSWLGKETNQSVKYEYYFSLLYV